MKSLSLLELMFLIRLIGDDLEKLERRKERCRRYIARGEDKHNELALTEAEYDALLSVKQKINAELALRDLSVDRN